MLEMQQLHLGFKYDVHQFRKYWQIVNYAYLKGYYDFDKFIVI